MCEYVCMCYLNYEAKEIDHIILFRIRFLDNSVTLVIFHLNRRH